MATKNNSPQGASRQEAPKQRPAGEIRYGRLKATIWRQESEQGPWYSVVVTRSYKDAQGEWASSQSFGRDDLLVLAKLCDQAHSWIYRQQAQDQASQATSPPPEREPGQDEDIPF